MKKIFNTLSLLFVFVLTISAQDISSALRQAEARFSSGNTTGAIELVNKVLAKYPNNKDAKMLLDKFNKTLLDREIEKDWNSALATNTFEGYQQFRRKHSASKYDDIASDNMAKRLADRFNATSEYSERTRAESYAKKSMTRDYIANKWKTAMSKRNNSNYSSSSSSSGYTYSSSNSNSSRRNSNSGSSYNSSYSSYDSSYGSSRNKGYSYKEKTPFTTLGIEGSIEGNDFYSWGLGMSMKVGRFNSMFNLTIGAKYQYTKMNNYLFYFNFDNYESGSADYTHTASQVVFPLILNWNLFRGNYIGFYLGLGYEFGLALNETENFDYGYEGFDMNEYYASGDYENYENFSVPSRDVIMQLGIAGRHLDWKIYYKIHSNSSQFNNVKRECYGTALIYYF